MSENVKIQIDFGSPDDIVKRIEKATDPIMQEMKDRIGREIQKAMDRLREEARP